MPEVIDIAGFSDPWNASLF